MVEHRPRSARAQERAREDDGMERDVVLADELEKLHAFRVLPPRFPVPGVAGGDRDVADGRVEPDVEDLALEPLLGHRDSPGQVARDGALLEPVADPGLGHLLRVVRPGALTRRLLLPGLEEGQDLGKVEVQVRRLLQDRRLSAEVAAGILQVRRIEKLAAVVALVAARVLRPAVRAGAVDVAVGQEARVILAVELLPGFFRDEAVRVEPVEDRLGDLRVRRRRRAAEPVEGDPEPGVRVGVDCVIAVAQLAGRGLFLDRPGLGGRAVLVRAADVECVVPALPARAGEHVRGKHLEQRAQVRDIVDVREGRGDQSSLAHG